MIASWDKWIEEESVESLTKAGKQLVTHLKQLKRALNGIQMPDRVVDEIQESCAAISEAKKKMWGDLKEEPITRERRDTTIE